MFAGAATFDADSWRFRPALPDGSVTGGAEGDIVNCESVLDKKGQSICVFVFPPFYEGNSLCPPGVPGCIWEESRSGPRRRSLFRSGIRNAGRSDIDASRRTRLAGPDPEFAVLVSHPSFGPPLPGET